MTPSKTLVEFGVSAGPFDTPHAAASHTYMTYDGKCPPTILTFPKNPYNENILRASNILEIGCGIGRNLPWIMENTTAHYYGVDPNQSMLDYFWEIQDAKWKPRVTLVDAFHHLPETLQVDVVLVTFVFQHIGFRPLANQMNVGDITLEALKYCAPHAVWFLYEHDWEEEWIGKWIGAIGIYPEVYYRNFTEIPNITDRGAHHLIMFKYDEDNKIGN